MAVTKETWVADIAENIYPDNSFYMGNGIDDSDSQVGKKVHVAQAGGVPGVTIDAAYTGGTTPVERDDTDADYEVSCLQFGPIRIKSGNKEFTSYDKRKSVMMDTYGSLETAIANVIAHAWAPTSATKMVRTSGADRAGYLATQTGNRKSVAYADFLKLQLAMNKDDIPQENRKVLLPAEMLFELQQIKEFMDYQNLGYVQELKKGIKGNIAGFDVYVRSKTPVYTNASTPVKRLLTATPAGSDNLSIIAWHPSFVRYSLGNTGNGGIEIFDNPGQAVHFGDLLSGEIYAGGRQKRSDGKGIYVLIEAAA